MLNINESSASACSTPVQTSEKRCENPDCHVNKLITMVPKRKTTQFVSEPTVMQKPMLVNGFTAVFQVDGESAKLMDIKNAAAEGPPNRPIYRIVPNSHVHVVNYVVVDTDESYLKKITDNDPVTMQKLLSSQKDSADQMLKKIMSGQGSTATAATTTVVSTLNTAANKPVDNNAPAGIPILLKPPNNPLQNIAPVPTVVGTGALSAPKNISKPAINLPVRMHPNLKITAVASAETLNAAPLNVSPAPNPPFIQPVPLASLQSPTPMAIPKIATTSSVAMKPMLPAVTDVVDKYIMWNFCFY